MSKNPEIAFTLSPADIEVSEDGRIRIVDTRVAETLKRAIESARARELGKAISPTAVRVSA